VNNKKIYLDYDPKYQGIVKTAAYLWFACFASLLLEVILVVTNLKLYHAASVGDWNNFLQTLSVSATLFSLTQANLLALRTIYILTIPGYLVAVWKIKKSASLALLGFTLVSLPVILGVHAFQLALVPLAHEYVNAIAVSGAAEAVKSSYLVNASVLYTMTNIGDSFVVIVLMNGALISWAFIAFQKPHPKYFGWWIIILVLLPFGQLIGMPLLGLANGILTGLFFVVMGFFMLRFEPLPKGGER